jgi:hypothetical protein
MALQSARAANLTVPAETLELAGYYLDSVATKEGSRYSCQAGRRADQVMTAEALLCREYLGWNLSTPGLRHGIDFLVSEHAPDARRANMYYWYYATQAVHHVGGSPWDEWNRESKHSPKLWRCRRREELISGSKR